jgi:hypothetical protein
MHGKKVYSSYQQKEQHVADNEELHRFHEPHFSAFFKVAGKQAWSEKQVSNTSKELVIKVCDAFNAFLYKMPGGKVVITNPLFSAGYTVAAHELLSTGGTERQ